GGRPSARQSLRRPAPRPRPTLDGVATDGLDGADPFQVYPRMTHGYWGVRRTASRLLLGGDDRVPGALDDGHNLGPLSRRDCELVERLRHVVHERLPLARRDAQVLVRALHVLAGVFLRTSGGPAQHLGNQVLEACRRHFVVRLVDQGIGVEPRVGHHAVDEVVYDGRDAVDTA